MSAAWYDLIAGVQSAIKTLALTYSSGTPLPDAQVYARKLPTDRATTVPFAMAAGGPRETHEAGSFEDHEAIYPVIVVFAFASNQDYSLNADLLRWRQQVMDMAEEFESTIQPLVPSGVITELDIQTEAALDPELWKQNLDVGGITLMFRTTRARSR